MQRRFFYLIPSLKTTLRIAIVALIVLYLGQSVIMGDKDSSGLEVLGLPLSAKLAQASMAVLSVLLVTLVYTVLIRRGSLMATTSLYPRRPIEANIGSLLDAAWPETSSAPCHGGLDSMIRLLYIGKMDTDKSPERVAKGRQQCQAAPIGEENRQAVWLTSGSALAKDVVQILIWEWVSLWLVLLMVLCTLLFNGFLNREIHADSYPRLVVTMIYLAGYSVHTCYVWIVCLNFFRVVFGGAAWSLLERAKFVVGRTVHLKQHSPGTPFQFRSIDKSSDTYVPQVFNAFIGGMPIPSRVLTNETLAKNSLSQVSVQEVGQVSNPTTLQDDPNELRAALATIDSAQKAERVTAMTASGLALDRVIANAMVMMSITLSSGFACWTSTQLSDDSPNNTTTSQVGSLALLASLSLGGAAMFTSAMHLNIMSSAFRTIVSLKETKINGLAIDHYRKQRSGGPVGSAQDELKAVSFTQNTIPLAEITFRDLFVQNRSRGPFGILGFLLMGPVYGLLPRAEDHERKSALIDFDFVAGVKNGDVVLTTRGTDKHAKRDEETNLEPINVCFLPEDSRYGKESC